MSNVDAHHAAAQAARHSYSRLVAWLAARTGDVASAQDALADAFKAALERWPEQGVPESPDAWLMRVASNRLIDVARKQMAHDKYVEFLEITGEQSSNGKTESDFPDERLKLLFICAHPAIDEAARTPLMLQTVLGLDAARIASAFLVSPTAMGQRLVRAKSKIKLARIPFVVPDPSELTERLDAVLDAAYVAYGTGWQDAHGADQRNRGLTEEAIWLARLIASLLPEQGSALGLLALMLYCESRKEARQDAQGRYVPLSKQDTERWDMDMLREAEETLGNSLSFGSHGRYQLEAAIQSAHVTRLLTGRANWQDVTQLYTRLLSVAPTIGSMVGAAAAVAELHGAQAGLDTLADIPEERITTHQPYWAVRADLLWRAGNPNEARAAYTHAIGLTEDGATREFLLDRVANLD